MQYVMPIKIVAQGNATNAETLLKAKPMQIGLNEPDCVTVHAGGYIVLDFGKEMNGGVRVLTFGSEGKPVRFRFGESFSECHAEIGGKQNATNNHALRDFKAELPSWSDMTFANTGYRYLRIDFEGWAIIKSIIGTNNILQDTPVYEYKGEDKLIGEIFSVAKRTLDLCAGGEYLWDGVKRDRLVWIGDIHPEMLGLTAIYGKMEKIEKSLDFVREQTPLPMWMNDYPMYSMWWIIIMADYAKRTNSYPFAKEQIPYLKGLLAQMNNCVKESGELNYPSYFVDWPTSGKVDEKAGVRAINIIACKKAIELLSYFNEDTLVVDEMLAKLLKEEIVVKEAKQVVGLKYFALGKLAEEDKALLIKGGVKGMSTFMSYYILKAVASFDEQKAIEMLKEYYGAMLKLGATTFWEDFDIDWVENSCDITRLPKENERDIHGDFGAYCYVGFRHSLCHGWSSGIVEFIKEYCK